MDAEPDHEYRGLIVANWDLLRGDTGHWGDRPLYRALFRRFGQPALDVGCATGRLLLDYLAEGLDVDGVDISPAMVALCLAKARERGLQPTTYRRPVAALDLPRRHGTIVVSSSTFQLLTDAAQARAAMRRSFAHLLPGGGLVMPCMLL